MSIFADKPIQQTAKRLLNCLSFLNIRSEQVIAAFKQFQENLDYGMISLSYGHADERNDNEKDCILSFI